MSQVLKRHRLNLNKKCVLKFLLLLTLALLIHADKKRKRSHYNYGRYQKKPVTKRICINLQNTIRAQHKTCFLRPDTGPCRADIIQWYFDVKIGKCFRFFWGGCQGNGNRFETKNLCLNYCYLNTTMPAPKIPYFCSLSFDYGTCFGQYQRWTWDKYTKSCKRRLYSGCGGNQNNFETKAECLSNCLYPPNNTLQNAKTLTTCLPYELPERK